MPNRFRPGRAAWAVLAPLVLAFTTPLYADLVFLKDGTVLQGQAKRETKVEFDPATHDAFHVPNGFFLLDDGPRRLYFCQTQAARVVPQKDVGETIVPHKFTFEVYARGVPPIHQILEVGAWNDEWKRKIRFRNVGNAVGAQQHLAVLTPYYARVESMTYWWNSYYLTRELGPDVVEGLLASNKDLQPDPKLPESERAARRFKAFDLLAQAGYYDRAEQALKRLVKELPEQAKQAEAARTLLLQMRAKELFEEIKRLQAAGRHQAAARRIQEFPESEASPQIAADFATFKANFDTAQKQVKDAQTLLDAVVEEFVKGGGDSALADAGRMVRAEIIPERVGRLEAFLGQAQQAARQRKQNKTPEVGDASLISLAVTGWLLGNPAAETKPETARRLWKARSFLTKYLSTVKAAEQKKLSADYQIDKDDASRIDELCQLVPGLPPVEPVTDFSTLPIVLKAGDGRRAPSYLALPPPEYTPARQYPVLIALHGGGEAPLIMMRRWLEAAADNGYLLIVPEWDVNAAGGYTYSEGEHAAVTDVLRDVRRRFQVDSDRVFLTGFGEGGNMAFDVGLSHPDLFAGVIPISGGPSYFSDAYWRSAQYLPFYVVDGDRSGEINKQIRDQFTHWVERGYNVIWSQYKGRGVEWFPAELTAITDWMRNRRRNFPLQQLGADGLGGSFGSEYYTMRQGDNRFYWLSTDAVNERCCNSVERWKTQITPATMTGYIKPADNEVVLKTLGLNQVTLWLGRNAKGQSQIDWDRPLTVYLNRTVKLSSRKVSPSLDVMLEDLNERGDRQQLYLQKIEMKP